MARRIGAGLVCLATAWTVPAIATLAVYVAPEDLARSAPLMVEGTVVSSRSGFDPETARLSTYVALDIEVVHRGPRDLRHVIVRELGGQFGDLIHVVDAVPRYRPGERVLAFLEPARDRALRTAGMHAGKFTIEDSARGPATAVRDLGGAGRTVSRGDGPTERLRLADLIALVAAVRVDGGKGHEPHGDRPGQSRGSSWEAVPPEYHRVLWDTPVRDLASRPERAAPARADAELPFVLAAPTNPARWYETDTGSVLAFDIERARNPLKDSAAAVDAVRRALTAWTAVPESRLSLAISNSNAAFTTSSPHSPAASYPSTNIVLFGDPYEDIPDPVGCSGTLAIGGYWSFSTTGPAVNGQIFRRTARMYVIFNDGFECFLGDPDNLAEVAAHEVGHGVGFGHSPVLDAIMRAGASGGRGSRLGDDDRDAAHCVYPHTRTVLTPNGGESWEFGSLREVRWSSTTESGKDLATVDLELSSDGGTTWRPLVQEIADDGLWEWFVTQPSGSRYRVRVVRPNRLPETTPAPFPARCSVDASDADFSLNSPPRPGVVPDGAGGSGIAVERASEGKIRLRWGASCSAEATAYSVYRGSLTALRLGIWDLASTSCAVGASRELELEITPASEYFLVAPLAGGVEGGLGYDHWGAPRPAAEVACAAQDVLGADCP